MSNVAVKLLLAICVVGGASLFVAEGPGDMVVQTPIMDGIEQSMLAVLEEKSNEKVVTSSLERKVPTSTGLDLIESGGIVFVNTVLSDVPP